MGTATRRRFTGLVFYPNGKEVSEMLELGGISEEVAEAEDRAVALEHERVFGNDPFIDDIMQLADWYIEGVEKVGTELTPVEHLATFFISAYSTIVAGSQTRVPRS